MLREWESQRATDSGRGTDELTNDSLASSNGQPVVSPLFSTVWKVKCQVGDVIASDSQVLFILEAMKTEVPVMSGEGSRGMVVSSLNVKEGHPVQPGGILASLS